MGALPTVPRVSPEVAGPGTHPRGTVGLPSDRPVRSDYWHIGFRLKAIGMVRRAEILLLK